MIYFYTSEITMDVFDANMWGIFCDFLHVAVWGIYDNFLYAKSKLLRRDYIGWNIKIMTPAERRSIFSKEIQAGGYSTAVMVKIFSDHSNLMFTADSYAELINHEVLHQVLHKVSRDARLKLDNIQKSYSHHDCETDTWSSVIKFHYKDGTIFETE